MRRKERPLVSVVMPVHNSHRFLADAVESILAQTHRDFEFIIVDDGSTDSSWEILAGFAQKDARITLLKNDRNRGVSSAVKKAIAHAQGLYIARMDSDDIAVSDRLQKQIEYLHSHPRTVAVGGQCTVIDEKGNEIGQKHFPCNFPTLYRSMFTFFPIQEPTLMIDRQKLPRQFQFYDKDGNIAEEVELIFKLFQYGAVENISNVLLKYRIHPNNSSLKQVRKTFYLTLKARLRAIFYYHYIPRIEDIAITIAQLVVVTLLPEKMTLFLYHKIRKLKTTKTPALQLVRYFVSS